MQKYDPCAYCANLTSGGVPDMFGDERCAGCSYADKVKKYEHQLGRMFDKLEQWKNVYAQSGDTKTASVIGYILSSMKAISEK